MYKNMYLFPSPNVAANNNNNTKYIKNKIKMLKFAYVKFMKAGAGEEE